MFQNYLKIALRNLFKNKLFSIINILGLAIGIACCLIMFLYVQNELSYDRFHKNADRIFRVTHERLLNGSMKNMASTPLIAAPTLKNDFPEIEYAVRILREFDPVVEYEDKQFIENNFYFVDSEILNVFSFNLKQGNYKTALQSPNSVIMSENVTQKYFGDENPVGKSITYRKWGQEYVFTVSGIFESLPANSHFDIEFMAPFESEQNLWNSMHGEDWFYVGSWTYLLLPNQQAAKDLEVKFPQFVQRHFPDELKEATSLELQALTDIHLHSKLENEIKANGNILYVYVFSAIALLVLFIACINFMNLSTARALGRAKEVGLRKVVGAKRSNLIWQFIGEALLLSFLSIIIAICLVTFFLPLLSNLLGIPLKVEYFGNQLLLPISILIGLVVGLISGSYPAFYLSSFGPVKVLKGVFETGSRGVNLRKLLVINQFTVSIVLLIAIAVISSQVEYMKNKNLGFNKEEIVFLKTEPGTDIMGLKMELEKRPDILEVIRGGSVPGSKNASTIDFMLFRPEGANENQRLQMNSTSIETNYLDLFDQELIVGRNFSQSFKTDESEAVIINEAAVREFGWQNNPIGKEIEVFNMIGASSGTRRVIGVVRDFHFESLHEKIKPLVMFTRGTRRYGNIIMRINTDNFISTIAYIKNTWKTLVPDFPLQLFFLNNDLNVLYQQEEKLGRITNFFSWLAVFISCLGLIGLATFATEKRTKEIGVRKVLGASVSSIVYLLSKEFLALIGIAFVISVPLGYFIMNQWLQDFAYRIELGASVFIASGFIAILIALVTISFQSINAALKDPVKTLRYE